MNYRHFRVPTAVLVSVSPENETIAVKSQENTVATTAQGGDVVDSWRCAYCAQCTPPTRLNCRVESRRRCVLNSQLFHDWFCGKIENWTIVANLPSQVGYIGNWVTTADGWVHTARHNSTQLDMFSFQFFHQIRRQSSWASCEFNTHRRRRYDSTRRRRRCVLRVI